MFGDQKDVQVFTTLQNHFMILVGKFFYNWFKLISSLQRNKRLNYYSTHERNKLIKESPSFYSYLHFTPFHSIGFKQSLVNLLIQPLVETYPLSSLKQTHDFIGEADLIIFESADGLL